jgi:hypothetical protein
VFFKAKTLALRYQPFCTLCELLNPDYAVEFLNPKEINKLEREAFFIEMRPKQSE